MSNGIGITRTYDSGSAGGDVTFPTVTSDNGLTISQDTDEITVNLPTGTSGQYMKLNGSTWTAASLPADATVSSTTGLVITQNSSAITVDLPSTGNDGDVLTWDDAGGVWEPQAPGAAGVDQLSELTDVNIPSPQDGEVLMYSSDDGEWTSEPLNVGDLFIMSASFDASQLGSTALSPAIPSGRRWMPIVNTGSIMMHCTSITGTPDTFNVELGSNVGFDDLRTAIAVNLPAAFRFTSAISYTATSSLTGTISINVTNVSTATEQLVTVYVFGYLL